MADYQETTSQSIENSARNSINTAKRAAQAVNKIKALNNGKKLIATAAKIKSVKYVAIIVAAFFAFILLTSVFYAGPMAVFERLGGFTETLNETYEQALYSAEDDNNVQHWISSIKALIKGLKAAIDEAWQKVSGQTRDSNDSYDLDVADDNDLLSMGETVPLTEEYEKKINAAKNKFKHRAESLKAAVNSKRGELNGWLASNVYPQDKASYSREEYEYESRWNNIRPVYKDGKELHEGYQTNEDMFVVEYGGLTLAWNVSQMSGNTAVDLIALCTTQYDNSAKNIKPSQFMKWLGYYAAAGGGPQVESIGGTGISSDALPKYDGIFMPQYLVDEMVQNEEGDYSVYGAPAVDALLDFSAPSFANLAPHIEDVEVSALVYYTHPELCFTGRYEMKREKVTKTYYTWFYVGAKTQCPTSYIPQDARNNPYIGRTVSTKNGRRAVYSSYTNTTYQWVTDYSKPIYEWRDVTYPTYQTKKIKVITYVANCAISCRSVRVLSSMVHFYDGEEKLNQATPEPEAS